MPTDHATTEYERWLAHIPAGEDRDALLAMQNDPEAIAEHFQTPMRFGTAGLRSTMDVGISHMNLYTVAQTTKGLAELVLQSDGQARGVAIAYDTRNNSRLFAETAARVLAAAGVQVLLFDGCRPTPELSFAILHHGCIAGINITASHNPKEYNGYKVYWEDGAQLPPEHAQTVSAAAAEADLFAVELADLDAALDSDLIRMLGSETDEAFLQAVQNCALAPDLVKQYGDSLHVVYTPLHGTGYRLIPECLRRCGVTNLSTVEQQMIPDGNFPTVASPNPENSACFALAAEQIRKDNLPCNMIIASDPDADRVGLALRGEDGEFYALSGNQIGALLIDYILHIRKEKGCLPANGCAIKSIVSSNLFDAICDAHRVEHISVLTGFKYIGEKIKQWAADGTHTFLFGYEESQGYLSDGYARDKDAVAASMLLVEMACYHAAAGRTVADALRILDETYGFYREKGLSFQISGIDPMLVMQTRMSALRQAPPTEIAGVNVLRVRDYLTGDIRSTDGSVEPTGLPSSDVLYYELQGGDSVIVRPSGTEPKIKVYLLVKADSAAAAADKLAAYAKFMEASIQA